MTDAKFKQLVNSFLDREISQKDHLLLSREVAISRQRRAEFERYRRLHAAERQALARLFASDEGVDDLDETDDALGQDAESGQDRRQRAEQLRARAARAWSEVQLLTVERKTRRLLILQFVLAGFALLFAALALYQYSVGTIPGGSYHKESEALNPESAYLARLREQLLAREGISVGWISNERGDPVVLVGRNDEGEVFVMTSSEVPQLSRPQLTALLNQIPQPPASGSAVLASFSVPMPSGTNTSSSQPLAPRNRLVVSAKVGSGLLPNVGDPLAPQFTPARQSQQFYILSPMPVQASGGQPFTGQALGGQSFAIQTAGGQVFSGQGSGGQALPAQQASSADDASAQRQVPQAFSAGGAPVQGQVPQTTLPQSPTPQRKEQTPVSQGRNAQPTVLLKRFTGSPLTREQEQWTNFFWSFGNQHADIDTQTEARPD